MSGPAAAERPVPERPVPERPATERPATERPTALTWAQLLWFAAALPFLGLAVMTGLGPAGYRSQIAAELPRLLAGVLDHRAAGGLLALTALPFLLAAVCAGPGRRWARTTGVTFTGLGDPALLMLFLGDRPRPVGWLTGLVVLLASLTAVVLSYRPAAERYLAGTSGRGDPLRSTP